MTWVHDWLSMNKLLVRPLGAFWSACALSVTPLAAEKLEPRQGEEREVDLRQSDKRQYHLFNPTPRAFLRELSTDRPDKTESPYTVDAGHFQIEMDLVSYSRDRDTHAGADTRVDSWAVAPIN